MVAPALIVASHNIRGTPESWRELDPFSAALLVEFGAGDEAGLDAAERRATKLLPAGDLIRSPSFIAIRRRSSSTGKFARGCTGWSARCAHREPR